MVACALVAVLFALALPATSKISEYNARTKSIANLRQIGVAARLYANEHNQQLPGQPLADGSGTGEASGQWPALFCDYLSPSNPSIFLDPGDRNTSRLPVREILSNVKNNTGFIYNGFDELGADEQPPAAVTIAFLHNQTETVLLAQKKRGATVFCLDPLFRPVSNLLDLLNPGAYDGGSHYLFVDGSVRYVKWADYTNRFWLVDKTFHLPLPPLPPLLRGTEQNGVRYAGPARVLPPLAVIR